MVEQPQQVSKKKDSAGLTQRFVALAFCRADLLFELDSSQHIVFSAGTTAELFGKTAGDLFGKPFTTLLGEADHELVTDLLMTSDKDGRIDDISVQLPLKSGALCDAVISGYRVPDFNHNFFLAVKVTPKRAQAAKPAAADRDPESGALNQKAFQAVAADRVRALNEAGADAKMTLVKVNNLGQARMGMSEEAHSRMVGAIGAIMNSQSAGGNTAGRIGDEHFGIVQSGDIDAAARNQKIENAAREMAPEGVEITAESQSVDADVEGLTEEQIAKAIGYTIKAYTDNKELQDPTQLQDMFETMMEETMKQVDAFKRICMTRDFDLAFMPICDLKTGEVHHLEALTRFRGSAGASGSPYQMITLAEEIGIIPDFDLAVARKAVDLVKKESIGGMPPLAVNVSGHSISDANFVKDLRELLRQATNLSQMISLEITESAEITDFDRVNAHIQEFRERNFHVALDDFGAGAASFDYLNSFDIDIVKFDGPVVTRAYQTAKGKAFLASMATLCKETGIETIAEMVEDQELAKFLRECGVDNGQGYFFGKPGPDPKAYKRKSI
ncbi:MAG: EAL domain-containing protein [Magnetovibrio sp.]|nr:EAL domain-containing protein [Magnetovibrio sp.]